MMIKVYYKYVNVNISIKVQTFKKIIKLQSLQKGSFDILIREIDL